MSASGRERDIRNAVHDALMSTAAFDAVWIWGLPEQYGSSAAKLAAVAIEPSRTTSQDLWDDATEGDINYTCTIALTFLFRHEDPQQRDEGVELLLNTAMNALNGQILVASLNYPAKTRITDWTWNKPSPPERRIRATLSVGYEVDGWNNANTTP